MSKYVDLQVNGYAGVDFNSDDLDEADFRAACAAMARDSVDRFLPTIITDELDRMMRRINRIARWVHDHRELQFMVAGIHVEGPFLSDVPGYVGAHPSDCTHDADPDVAMRLVDAGLGLVRLVTLAPERDVDSQTTRRLVDQGVVVAAGHSDASLDELQRAMDAGLSLFTHLGNACPGLVPRHDNIMTRVLSVAEQLSISLIADGHHLPWHTFATFIKCIPPENLIVVSDAISAAGLGPGIHRLASQEVEVDPDGAAWAKGREHFAGCATPMCRMQELLQEHLAIDPQTCETWMSTNPARLIDR